jgi:hypothetical protein
MHFKGDPIPSVDCPRGRGQRQLLFEWVGSCGGNNSVHAELFVSSD